MAIKITAAIACIMFTANLDWLTDWLRNWKPILSTLRCLRVMGDRWCISWHNEDVLISLWQTVYVESQHRWPLIDHRVESCGILFYGIFLGNAKWLFLLYLNYYLSAFRWMCVAACVCRLASMICNFVFASFAVARGLYKSWAKYRITKLHEMILGRHWHPAIAKQMIYPSTNVSQINPYSLVRQSNHLVSLVNGLWVVDAICAELRVET